MNENKRRKGVQDYLRNARQTLFKINSVIVNMNFRKDVMEVDDKDPLFCKMSMQKDTKVHEFLMNCNYIEGPY